ncbi:MAG: mitochondrial 2-enoyl thioester reductase [Trizodia sp. TS-e1964]|nr:MAG: mitochondrial 2-enoyl thioester reductase [Trizodia sp. TS-e1964]
MRISLLRLGHRAWPLYPVRHTHQKRWISAFGYEQAKALVYSQHGEPQDVLSLHTHSISPAHSTQVNLRFLSAPINPADINQLQGVYPSQPPFTPALGTAQPSAVAGNEGAAEVLSVGSAVRSVQPGDWVIPRTLCFGTWRTHAQADENQVLRIEKQGISAAQAGTVAVNPCTAYRLLLDFAALRPGDWFVQNGANSGVGRAAVQLGRLRGFRSINVVRVRPGVEALKQELRLLGADQVVTEEELMARGFGEQVKEWTNAGRSPIKLVLNCVGGKPAIALAKLLSPGGHFVTYGGMSRQPMVLPVSLQIFRDIHFDGFWLSRWSEANPEEKKATVEDVLQFIREGLFKDAPLQEIEWTWETTADRLKKAAAGALEGFRTGKGMFIFKDT